MTIKITIEILPLGDTVRRYTHAVIIASNDGTGNHAIGNYIINAEGECANGTGWDSWEGFPKRLVGVDRSLGYEQLAKAAMKII